jgi:glutamate dehydrogenase/leucine dehydrogenase
VIPDFIANEGGVICAATEYSGGTARSAFEVIGQRTSDNTRRVIEESRRAGSPPRSAAMALAERRLREAMATRRWR